MLSAANKNVTKSQELSPVSDYENSDHEGSNNVESKVNNFPQRNRKSLKSEKGEDNDRKAGQLRVVPISRDRGPIPKHSYMSPTQEWLSAHPEIDKNISMELCSSLFPEAEIRQNLIFLQATQPAIDAASQFLSQFINPPGPLFQIMAEEYNRNDLSNNCLAIFYLYNHLIQNYQSVSPKSIGSESFPYIGYERFILVVAPKVVQKPDNREYIRCVRVWMDRGIYSREMCEKIMKMISPSGSSIGSTVDELIGSNPHVSNSLGPMIPLVLANQMPQCGQVIENATQTIQNLSSAEYNDDLLEEVSIRLDRASKMTGQEIILLQAGLLDLSALIEDNQDSIIELRKQLELCRN